MKLNSDKILLSNRESRFFYAKNRVFSRCENLTASLLLTEQDPFLLEGIMPTGIYDRTKSKPNMGEFKKGEKKLPRSEEYRQNIGKAKMREKNGMWNGGITSQRGYIKILKPNHPFAGSEGYVRRSRLTIEEYLGRYLKSQERVHHVNGKKDDDRIENLMAFSSHSAHLRFHKNPNNVKAFEIIFDGRIMGKIE